MSSDHLRNALALLAMLLTVVHGNPLHFDFNHQQLAARGVAADHPVSGISDFKPASIAPYEAGDTNEDVAICLGIKDEYHDVTEWLVHHYNHHGIRRFYLMDDGSDPKLSSYDYSEFVDPRVITHKWMKPEERHQIYSQCVSEFGANHKWMGFIDTDEFLEVKAPDTLHGMLSALESNETVGALGINWLNHNSGGLESRASGQSVRKSFTQCLTDSAKIQHGGNRFIKSFVKTSAWRGVWKVHKAQLIEGMQTVGENGDFVTEDMIRVPSTKDKIVLHHYAVKSRKEYEVKLSRGDIMFAENLRGQRYWREFEEAPSYECTEMAAYSP